MSPRSLSMGCASFDLVNDFLCAGPSGKNLFVNVKRFADHCISGKLSFHPHSGRFPVLNPKSWAVKQETDSSSQFLGAFRGNCQTRNASHRYKWRPRIEERINDRSPTCHGLELN